MDSKALNEEIRKVADDDQFFVRGLQDTGKSIPYFGWFWREVNFDELITLGFTDRRGGMDMPTFVGFMENNKWGYPSFICSEGQSWRIRHLLELAVTQPSNETLQAVFDYIQTLRPTRNQRSEAEQRGDT